MRFHRTVFIQVCCALVAAFFGFAFVCSTEWPRYRTIEIAPGQFTEQWMPAREFWFSLVFGVALFVASGYLFRSAYREFTRNAA